MTKKVVAVLFGGQSSEHEISRISASTIISNLSKEKYSVLPIYISKKGEWKIYDGPIENICSTDWEAYSTNAIISPDTSHKGIIRIIGDKIRVMPIDVVIPVLHGKWGEDGTIQGLLELARIPYVGCNVLSSAVSMDKLYTKIIADSINIEQAKYKVVYKHNMDNIDVICKEIENYLGYPCFVKPANAGSSKGVSKANNIEELKEAINNAFLHDVKAVIEENIDGREVECAVLGNYDVKATNVGEVLSAADFYDFDAKYNNQESKTVIPANIPLEIAEEIREKAINIFKALDGRGLSRVDFFIQNKTNKVIFNEINTFPGFTSISMYHMLWRDKGLLLPELLDNLIDLAFEDFNNKNVE
ncbi:D-alanine--D-alanine ligase family protein [uncultured Tyzzerella sp.]|uniref:D-alanine--D-alanine ligase family protein n=1 Tax=uncultured Tyzzerella sp. TaxID=2321398 RepID=UPI0029434491|nr:D-alanine--D-alanine ligase family protein [uncultured Tyzzerella sp.]